MTENVFLFVPNIVDYLRVITAFVSFYYMPFDPWRASFWYLLSGFLDAIDGHLARMLNQSSKLGALLDQLIDRCATMCLCGALCYFYPDYLMFFQFYMALDITSHWFHLQSTLMKGAGSHKVLDLSANPLLRHYYHNRKILFIMCSANEVFFCMLYLTHFSAGPTLGFGLGLWQVLLYLTAPLAALKTLISGVQLWAACKNIAAIDVADREAARQKQQ